MHQQEYYEWLKLPGLSVLVYDYAWQTNIIAGKYKVLIAIKKVYN
jgi:hypothetical protein